MSTMSKCQTLWETICGAVLITLEGTNLIRHKQNLYFTLTCTCTFIYSLCDKHNKHYTSIIKFAILHGRNIIVT